MEKPHRQLRVWRDSMEFVETVYGVTSGFPSGERFGLVSQMRRCAVSIPSNIAEGAAKHSAADYCRFLTIAIGSVAELDTQLELSKRLGFLSKEAHSRTDTKLNALSRMLVALRRSIQSR